MRRKGGLKPAPEALLFLISFAVLFFELFCIRWISSTVAYVGLFSNLILLAAFLGIGLGFLSAKNSLRLIDYFPPFLFFLVFGLASGVVSTTFYSRALLDHTVSLVSKGGGGLAMDPSLVLLAIFAFVAAMFATLSQEMGRLFPLLPPLRAYSVNVAGSIAGLAAFSAMSLMSLGPMAWLAAFLAAFLAFRLLLGDLGVFAVNFIVFVPVAAACVWVVSYGLQDTGYEVHWSPYYKVERVGDTIFVNRIGHQTIRSPPDMETVQYPPRYVTNRSFGDVLIIGSGTGTDTAAALYFGAERVDAVEIDPAIIELGRLRHPARPYQAPGVTVINDDARSYLSKTGKKYDLIVYGLTDSVAALSAYGSLRLESYLYTVEAFAEARRHLKDGGMLVTGNYYPERWYADKLDAILAEAFGEAPKTIMLAPKGEEWGETIGVMTFSGPGAAGMKAAGDFAPGGEAAASTDDWPFFYLRTPSIPAFYLKGMLLIGFFSAAAYWAASRLQGGGLSRRFFFMGAAFMLLEAKSVVNLSLLFGATWLVNALAFAAVLISILAAVHVSGRWGVRDLRPWYAALIALLALNYLVPLSVFLVEGPLVRYVLSSLFLFSPVFAANVIFAASFRDSKETQADFASNLFGSLAGGFAEYLSLIFGYRSLALLAAAFYALAFAPKSAD
jgi:SAM-dependent methyltransferase